MSTVVLKDMTRVDITGGFEIWYDDGALAILFSGGERVTFPAGSWFYVSREKK